MSDKAGGQVICVTGRRLCPDDFLGRLARIAAARPHAVILREKDLPPADYAALARDCCRVCARSETPLIAHSHVGVAHDMGSDAIHLPFPAFEREAAGLAGFRTIGVSVHSAEEAKAAAGSGATYLVAGHIFATGSKQGLPPRGLSFLEAVCRAVTVPVFAIGGITPERFPDVLTAGAAGACVMSALMTADDPAALLSCFKTR